MPEYKPTKKQRIYYRFMGDALRELEWDIRHPVFLRMKLPQDWHSIAESPSTRKRRITIRIDDDVVRFFKGLGPGYQAKVNRVLAAFMNARLAGLVDGPESIDYVAEGIDDDEYGVGRPQPGDYEARIVEVMSGE